LPALDARTDDACGAVEAERAVVRLTALVQQRRDATGAVAALLHLIAVTVEDAIEHRSTGAACRLQHQCLIEADAGAAIGQAAQPLRREQRGIGGRIKHNEIVADPVHLREVDAHRGASIA